MWKLPEGQSSYLEDRLDPASIAFNVPPTTMEEPAQGGSMTLLLTQRPRPHRPPEVPADRQRHAKALAYLGCTGAFGYGLMKVIWVLGGTIGLRNPTHFHATEHGLNAPGRFFDQWGSQILAGLAIVILLGLIYPWGHKRILRPLLRTLAWAGSLIAVWGAIGLILTILYYAGDHGAMGLGDLQPGTYLFTYICFLTLGVGFAGTAWLTRRRPRRSTSRNRTAAFRERSTPIPH